MKFNLIVLFISLTLTTWTSGQSKFSSHPGNWYVPLWKDPGNWQMVNVADHQIFPNGEDVAPKLNKLINSLDGNIILKFSKGIYTFNSGLDIKRGNIWMSGAGANQTRFIMKGKNGYTISFSGSTENAVLIQESIAKGSSKVIVSNELLLEKGDVVEISQRIPDTVPHYEGVPSWNAGVQNWGKRGYAYLSTVKSVKNKVIALNIPTPLSFSPTYEAEVKKVNTIQNIRIEGIAFERSEANNSNTIEITNAENVWIRNIASLNTAKYHLSFTRCINVVVEGSYFGGTFVSRGGGQGYGVDLRYSTTRALITNNVFRDLRHHVMLQIGANQCIISYNYIVDYKNRPDFSLHGHYPHHILFEGNRGWRWGIGDWWGPTGPGMVLFRNKIIGVTDGDGENVGIMIWLADYGQHIVGNDFEDKAWIQYRAGHSDTTDFVFANSFQQPVSNNNLPSSLYLKRKPHFWPDSLPWPAYGPGVHRSVKSKIPAEIRWENRGDGLPVSGQD